MLVDLVLRENNVEAGQFRLGAGEYVIGRDPACDVLLASQAVSRRHARLTITESDVYLEDLGSANGTEIDGGTAQGRVRLRPRQRIRIGLVDIETRWQAPDAATVVGSETIHAATTAEAALRGRRYALGEVVASGGMGVIRQVRDRHLRRAVAMKALHEEMSGSESKRLRFLEEAQVTGQLEHPNIVPVYDLGLDDGNQPFYTMKWVRGITLRVVLEDIRAGNADTIKQYPLVRLLTIFQKTCDAVAFAHSKGVVHRDIKPENIMIGDFGEVLLMDWGLAKAISRRPLHLRHTADPLHEVDVSGRGEGTLDGVVLGTPQFMSPEQAHGRIDQIDERTDIFMLGAVLYNILALEPPFSTESTEKALAESRTGSVRSPLTFNRGAGAGDRALAHCPDARIPESLAAVAMKAMQAAPDRRYQAVRSLQSDIESYLGGFATSAEQAGFWKQFVLLVRRRKVEVSLLALALTALLVVAGVSVSRIIASEKQTQRSLAALRAAAPAYRSQAENLVAQHHLEEALGKITTAIELVPDDAEFHLLRGNILQSLLRMEEAKEAYRRALQLDPGSEPAWENIQLCEQILADNEGREQLRPSSLAELHAAMLRQQRSAEALAMVRQLGEGNRLLYDTWRSILEEAGLLEKATTTTRLIVDENGTFYLNLNRTKTDSIVALRGMPLRELHLMLTEVRDLYPLVGTALSLLNLAGSPVSDLEPLRGMPLRVLVLAGCRNVTDLSPLAECAELEVLILPPQAENPAVLRDLPNLKRMSGPPRAVLGPEELMRRFSRLEFHAKRLQGLGDETLPAPEFWKQHDTQPAP